MRRSLLLQIRTTFRISRPIHRHIKFLINFYRKTIVLLTIFYICGWSTLLLNVRKCIVVKILFARSTAFISIPYTMPESNVSITRVKDRIRNAYACKPQKVTNVYRRYTWSIWQKWSFSNKISVAWFQMDPATAHSDLVFSKENAVVSGTSSEYRTVLGSVSFTKGIHYWEVQVDRRDNNADVVVGIAIADVSKDSMLGMLLAVYIH